MYQSPVAAVAVLIANAWDVDATRVSVTLPGVWGVLSKIAPSAATFDKRSVRTWLY